MTVFSNPKRGTVADVVCCGYALMMVYHVDTMDIWNI